MYFFTSDEHYGHVNLLILNFCNRPFKDIYEMDQELIRRHNEVVSSGDIVVHAGDFAVKNRLSVNHYINQLKGEHIFLKGSHDKWIKGDIQHIWTKKIEEEYVIACHYAMLVWPKSHYGSWQLYGHSHGRLNLETMGKQYDIGVDNNNFYPVSFQQIKEIMKTKPDNFNLIRRK